MAVWSGVLATGVLTGGALAQPQVPSQQSSRDAVRLSGLPGGVFQFSQGRQRGQTDLSQQLHGCTSATYDPTAPDFQGFDIVTGVPGAALGTRVIDLVQRGGRWYLTFQVSVPPNCNVQGMCGAGTNIDLVWLKLSPSLKVLGKQVEVVEDCRSDTNAQDYTGTKDSREASSGQPLLELRVGQLRLTRDTAHYGADGAQTHQRQRLSYSRAAPQQGIRVGPLESVTK